MKTYRKDVINEMMRINRELLDHGSTWQEILQYLVDKFRPSFYELRTAKYRIQEFIHGGIKDSETGLLANILMRREIRLFNKEMRFNQVIGTEKRTVIIIHPKTGKQVTRKQYLLGLGIGDIAAESDARHADIERGIRQKRRNLKDRIQNPQQYRAEADKLRRILEKRLRKRS